MLPFYFFYFNLKNDYFCKLTILKGLIKTNKLKLMKSVKGTQTEKKPDAVICRRVASQNALYLFCQTGKKKRALNRLPPFFRILPTKNRSMQNVCSNI